MIIDTIEQIWKQILDITAVFVIPEWGAWIGLLPVLLLVGVVGPILSLLVLAWLRYGLLRPKAKATFADARRAAPIGPDGRPVYPAGEPYSLAEGTIYEPGATRSLSGDTLVVACPKCHLVRSAATDTCGNCGLAFSLKPVTRSLRPASPPSGGAAAA